jgi:hypothetical protein
VERLSANKRAMARWIVIDFAPGAADLHMIGNWVEDVWASLRDDHRAFVDWDTRHVTERLQIAVVHGRDLKSVRGLIERTLDAHGLKQAATISAAGAS